MRFQMRKVGFHILNKWPLGTRLWGPCFWDAVVIIVVSSTLNLLNKWIKNLRYSCNEKLSLTCQLSNHVVTFVNVLIQFLDRFIWFKWFDHNLTLFFPPPPCCCWWWCQKKLKTETLNMCQWHFYCSAFWQKTVCIQITVLLTSHVFILLLEKFIVVWLILLNSYAQLVILMWPLNHEYFLFAKY